MANYYYFLYLPNIIPEQNENKHDSQPVQTISVNTLILMFFVIRFV